MTDPVLADVLQSYEAVLETLKRVTAVASRLVEAMQSGESLRAGELAEYGQQLRSVEQQRVRLEQLVGSWWQLLGQQRPM